MRDGQSKQTGRCYYIFHPTLDDYPIVYEHFDLPSELVYLKVIYCMKDGQSNHWGMVLGKYFSRKKVL